MGMYTCENSCSARSVVIGQHCLRGTRSAAITGAVGNFIQDMRNAETRVRSDANVMALTVFLSDARSAASDKGNARPLNSRLQNVPIQTPFFFFFFFVNALDDLNLCLQNVSIQAPFFLIFIFVNVLHDLKSYLTGTIERFSLWVLRGCGLQTERRGPASWQICILNSKTQVHSVPWQQSR